MKAPYVKFFRNVKTQPRRFNHISRFYDEKKEKSEARRKRVEMEVALEQGDEVEEYVSSISFSRHKKATSGAKKFSQSQKKAANLRLIIILIFLGALAYYAIKYLESFG